MNYLLKLVQSWIFLPSIPCFFNWVQLMRKSLTGDAQLAVRERSRRAKFQICTDKFSRFIFPLPTLFLPFTHIHAQPHSELYEPEWKSCSRFQWTRTPASERQMRLVKAHDARKRRKKIRLTEITRQFFHFSLEGRRASSNKRSLHIWRQFVNL